LTAMHPIMSKLEPKINASLPLKESVSTPELGRVLNVNDFYHWRSCNLLLIVAFYRCTLPMLIKEKI